MATSSVTSTVRVRESTRRALAEMAKRDGKTIAQVIAALVDRARADEIVEQHTRAISADPAEGYVADEVEAWDQTLLDGLEDDPWPTDDEGRPIR